MSRQRCAGRRGGKAEFPCGLMGRGVGRGASLSAGSVSRRFVVGWECVEVLRCRLGVCRGASLSAGSVSNCGGIFGWVLRDFFLVYGMVGISYKIFLSVWTFLKL